MFARVTISEGRDGERTGMGRHMPAVGQQRHGPEYRTAHDLDDHHRSGEPNHQPSPPLVTVVARAKENVIMAPSLERIAVHQLFLSIY